MDDELSTLIGALAEAASLSARDAGVDVAPFFGMVDREGNVLVTAFEQGYLSLLNDKAVLAEMMTRLVKTAGASSAGFGASCGVAGYQAGDEVGRRRIEKQGVGEDPGYAIWVTDGQEERIFCSPVVEFSASSARLTEWIAVPGPRFGGILADAIRAAVLAV